MKIANRISAIVCDDIRNEAGHKHSLMGIYGTEIVLNKLPAILPQLCLCIVLEDIKSEFDKCEVTLKAPKIEPQRMTLKLNKEEKIGSNITMFAFFVPFRVVTVGEAKFEVRFGENKRPSIVRKLVIKTAVQPKKS